MTRQEALNDWAKSIRGSDGFLIDIRTVCEKYINQTEKEKENE